MVSRSDNDLGLQGNEIEMITTNVMALSQVKRFWYVFRKPNLGRKTSNSYIKFPFQNLATFLAFALLVGIWHFLRVIVYALRFFKMFSGQTAEWPSLWSI
jgi:hypothetical protein